MHLKNFSLLENASGGWELSPAYDLVPVQVVLPDDPEESALSLNGKKNRLRRADFLALAEALRLTPKQTGNALARIVSAVRERLPAALDASFLPPAMQEAIASLAASRLARLEA